MTEREMEGERERERDYIKSERKINRLLGEIK